MEPTSRRKEQQRAFHQAALDAWQRHGFKSYRQAESQTGVNYSTIYTIVSRGRIPTRGQVIEWAEGLGEDVNHWLELAGYEPIPPELIAPDVMAWLRSEPHLTEEEIQFLKDLIEKEEEAHRRGEHKPMHNME